MALGRIRRDRARIKRAYMREASSNRISLRTGRATGIKRIGVNVDMIRVPSFRGSYQYAAKACLRTVTRMKSCGYLKSGRTPQSATAKALKSLSSVVARRGRRKAR